MKTIYSLLLSLLFTMTAAAQTTQQADSLHQQGRALLSEGKIAEGRELTRRAMEMRRTLLGEVSIDYITSLNNYAQSFAMEENYTKAVELQEQVMALSERLTTPHPNLGTYAANMGRFCYLIGNKQRAAKYWEQALPLVEKHGQIYEYLLKSLSTVYDELEDTQNTDRIMALMLEHDAEELKKPCDEPACMLDRAKYYDAVNNQDMARECFLKVLAMPMDDEMKQQVHEAYARHAAHYAHDYQTAAEYCLSAATLRKAISGENDAWAQLLFTAGQYAFISKNYPQAAANYQQAGAYYATKLPASLTQYPACLKGEGNAYNGQKDYARARDCFRLLVSFYQQNDTLSQEYPRAILRLAKAEKFNKEYPVSIDHHKQAMQLFEQRGMVDDYSDASSSLQFCYLYAGVRDTVEHRFDRSEAARLARIDTIINHERSHLEIARKYLGKLTYANALGTLAGCYKMKEQYDSCLFFNQQYIEAIREAIRDEFRTKTENERMLVWNGVKEYVKALTDLLDAPVTLSQLPAACYDAELLSKGILLNSSIEFGRVLQSQGDPQLVSAYEQIQANETEMQQIRQNATSEADLQRLLTLTQQNQTLQQQLYRGCSEYADFTNYMAYTWRDVQQALQPADVAIEFAVVGSSFFPADNHLTALVLTKDMAAPVAVSICNLQQLQQMEENASVTTETSPLWAPLRQHLTGHRRVFFSAVGSLNRMGIEYLSYDGKPLADQYEVYRLSSTKELCRRHDGGKPSKVALFGAIDYGQAADMTEAARESLMAMRGSVKGFQQLGNTRREVDAIGTTLREASVSDVATLTGSIATRDAFLSLSDSRVALLHIATHGAYKADRHTSDAESMTKSLLAFAGANKGTAGLVTAADIAAMNLRHCDLAVLSACETGLGKLGDDGVFGLQRGFKNAGVHTLLMSLKEVYDDSTAELMIAFYRHLMAGTPKREALIRAQQELRAKGYDDPKYWATFILLDAL